MTHWSKKMIGGVLSLAILVPPYAANASLTCSGLFDQEQRANDELTSLLNEIRAQKGFETELAELLRYERRRDRFRRWNGRAEANYTLRISRVLRQLESLLYRGETNAVLNVLRPIYRPVEIQYAQLVLLDNQIAQLKEKSAMAKGPALASALKTLEKLQTDRTAGIQLFGRHYTNWVSVKKFMDSTIKDRKIIRADKFMNEFSNYVKEAVVMPPPDPLEGPKLDPLSPAARLKLYVETAETAEKILGVEKYKTWFPKYEAVGRNPSLEEVRDYFKSHPDALLASLKYQASQEVGTFAKFFFNRSTLLAKALAYKLPEEVKGVQLRRPITDAIGLSYDLDLLSSYSDRIIEINRSDVSTEEKFSLLLKKAAGAPADKFYETFARMPDMEHLFKEMKTFAQDHDQMVYQNMVAAEATRSRLGDLPDEGTYSPADASYRIALAIMAGTFGAYIYGQSDNWKEKLFDWLESGASGAASAPAATAPAAQ